MSFRKSGDQQLEYLFSYRSRKIMKICLIIANCIYGMFGLSIIGVGIYLAADKLYFVPSVLGISIVTSASHFIISAGSLVFLASFIGCMGAFYENRILLIINCTAFMITFMLAAYGVTLAIVFRSWFRDQVRNYMRQTLQESYGVELNKTKNIIITRDWDSAQQKWYCCGVEDESWGVYRSSKWYAEQEGLAEDNKPLVPESCCRKDQYGNFVDLVKCQTFFRGPPTKSSSEYNECLYYRGCYDVSKNQLYPVSSYLIGMGMTLLLILLPGVVLSLSLSRLGVS